LSLSPQQQSSADYPSTRIKPTQEEGVWVGGWTYRSRRLPPACGTRGEILPAEMECESEILTYCSGTSGGSPFGSSELLQAD